MQSPQWQEGAVGVMVLARISVGPSCSGRSLLSESKPSQLEDESGALALAEPCQPRSYSLLGRFWGCGAICYSFLS